MSALVGCEAIASTAPLTAFFCPMFTTLGLPKIGPGPCSAQSGTPLRVIVGASRSSSRSRAGRVGRMPDRLFNARRKGLDECILVTSEAARRAPRNVHRDEDGVQSKG